MNWIIMAAIMGASAVMAGAFGAHGLKERVEPVLIETWKTGALYHLVHSVALLGLAFFAQATERSVTLPSSLFCLGILLFSGSLYLLVLTGVKGLGAVTPIGGLILIAAWLSLISLRT
jgi:uncharacterized membrane protein YgdD (TMEM256/DUF423 family)